MSTGQNSPSKLRVTGAASLIAELWAVVTTSKDPRTRLIAQYAPVIVHL